MRPVLVLDFALIGLILDLMVQLYLVSNLIYDLHVGVYLLLVAGAPITHIPSMKALILSRLPLRLIVRPLLALSFHFLIQDALVLQVLVTEFILINVILLLRPPVEDQLRLKSILLSELRLVLLILIP